MLGGQIAGKRNEDFSELLNSVLRDSVLMD